MAAGGFKTFLAGSILTAADTNDFLMQGVLVFADAAARDAAITAPVEGQFVFLKDTDVTQFYDGTAFVELSTPGTEFEYLIIGGGAGGARARSTGGGRGGGGGGAGGYVCSVTGENSGGGVPAEPKLKLESGSYTVNVGAGGPGGLSFDGISGIKGNGSGFWQIRAEGGGTGGADSVGGFGGSGGGGRASNFGLGLLRQGFNGGNGQPNEASGGGGGAGGVGGDAPPPNSSGVGGIGGAGLTSGVTGSSVARGGGGGGGGLNSGGSATAGGGAGSTGAGGAATVNTGGGGGGAGNASNGGAGGSGLVVLRYPDSITLTIGAGLTSTTATAGGFKTTTFTAGMDTVSF